MFIQFYISLNFNVRKNVIAYKIWTAIAISAIYNWLLFYSNNMSANSLLSIYEPY